MACRPADLNPERLVFIDETGAATDIPSKLSSQQSPTPSPKSVTRSVKTTSQTKAIAANYENALSSDEDWNRE